MKIVFLCGSLELGKDGVGDYVRRLSGELIRQGNQVMAIALNDRNITEEFFTSHTIENIAVCRFPSILPIQQRFLRAKHLITLFQPDCISLQYVPYSFHKYGFPVLLGKMLGKLAPNSKWHTMVHEPHLASKSKMNLKNSIITIAQKISLQLLKIYLRPVIFHTSINHYRKMLSEINIDSEILDLFGNIPLNPFSINPLITKLTDKHVIGIFFGSAPAPDHHYVFERKLYAFFKENNFNVTLVLCGKLGKNGPKFIESIEKSTGQGQSEVIVTGELSENDLSYLFSIAHFGISRVPPHLLGKSGSIISMLEHGLPVWFPLHEDNEANVFYGFRNELCFYNLEELFNYSSLQKLNYVDHLPTVASRFISAVDN